MLLLRKGKKEGRLGKLIAVVIFVALVLLGVVYAFGFALFMLALWVSG